MGSNSEMVLDSEKSSDSEMGSDSDMSFDFEVHRFWSSIVVWYDSEMDSEIT